MSVIKTAEPAYALAAILDSPFLITFLIAVAIFLAVMQLPTPTASPATAPYPTTPAPNASIIITISPAQDLALFAVALQTAVPAMVKNAPPAPLLATFSTTEFASTAPPSQIAGSATPPPTAPNASTTNTTQVEESVADVTNY